MQSGDSKVWVKLMIRTEKATPRHPERGEELSNGLFAIIPPQL